MTADNRLSDVAQGLEGSRILAIATQVRERIAAGEAVAPYTVGDFSPNHYAVPKLLKEAMLSAIELEQTNYPPASGLPELRSAISDWMNHRFGLETSAANIIIGSGARPPLYASLRLLLEPGDGFAHGVPAWNNHYYAHLNQVVDIPFVGTAETRFLPTAAQVAERIEHIRVLMLNSPLNPTGTCFRADELGAICDVVLGENKRREGTGAKPIMVVYDQVYSTMTGPGIEHVHPIGVRPEMEPYTIMLDAISKSITATGLRVGWMVIPEALAPKATALIGHMGAWPARPIQQAVAELYSNHEVLERYFDDLDDQILSRLNIIQTRLSQMREEGHDVDYVAPEGGIYLTTRFNLFEALDATTNEEIRQWLLEEAGVAVVPFQAFGLENEDGWVRISVGAVGVQDVVDSMDRLKVALEGLR